jgi:hypothetical protein
MLSPVSSFRLLVNCLALLAACAAAAASDSPGDRHPGVTAVFPPEVFTYAGQGGRMVDVTKPPFNAKGDGKADDTAALVSAYEFVLHEMDRHPWDAGGPLVRQPSYVIYLPAGTYLVSDTVIYRGPLRWVKNGRVVQEPRPASENRNSEAVVQMRFVGENRERTVIRLRDSAPGFESGKEKPVLSLGKGQFNNRVAGNSVRNLTIDTGRGNPGAAGINLTGANNLSLMNLTIRSQDRQGFCGLLLRIPPTMGWHHDITVEGFDYGICMEPYHVSPNAFEYVTLRCSAKDPPVSPPSE